jgi:hypothetical protein
MDPFSGAMCIYIYIYPTEWNIQHNFRIMNESEKFRQPIPSKNKDLFYQQMRKSLEILTPLKPLTRFARTVS